jgi:ribosomal protein S18 acetylase RimI-like enzyme
MRDQNIAAPTVRECTARDAASIAQLGARLFREAYGPTHPEPELSRYLSREYTPEIFAAAIAQERAFVLVLEDVDGAPIGFSWVRRSEVPPDGVPGDSCAEIVRFYVATERQGRKLGRLLMTHCVDAARARGYDSLWLQVWKEAPWAIGFYHRMGFQIAGSALFYFGATIGYDHVMQRAL